MSLLESIRERNSALSAPRLVAKKRAAELATRTRRVTLFREAGPIWFGELQAAISELIRKANALCEDGWRSMKVSRKGEGEEDQLEITFIHRAKHASITPAMTIRRVADELLVVAETRTPEDMKSESFRVLPTEAHEFKVFRSAKVTERSVLWPEDEGRKTTGDLSTDLRLSERTTSKDIELKVNDLADYLLEGFFRTKWTPPE